MPELTNPESKLGRATVLATSAPVATVRPIASADGENPVRPIDGEQRHSAPLALSRRAIPASDRVVSVALLDAVERASDVPMPGSGRTAERFARLAAVAERDLVLARLLEGHLDALAILAEAGVAAPDKAVLGVWAARGREARLTARRDRGGWHVSGSKPYASGASTLTHALVTADAPEGGRLFLIDARGTTEPVPGTWLAVGMRESDSATVEIDARLGEDDAIGGVGWYTARPGFWHGSVGVAACWLGGARAVARPLQRAASPHALAHLGAVDAYLAAASTMLEAAAEEIDAAPAIGGEIAERRARRVRAVVESAANEALTRVGRALGAGPLCHDLEHAHRVADLTVYLRQSHAESDLERLGRLVGTP